jgi:hypothetical protein
LKAAFALVAKRKIEYADTSMSATEMRSHAASDLAIHLAMVINIGTFIAFSIGCEFPGANSVRAVQKG